MTIMLFLMASLLGQVATQGFNPDVRIEQAITIVRPVAYRSKRVNWRALARDMRRRTAGARDDVDMLPAWAALARGLGDGHSFIQPTDAALAVWRKRYGNKNFLSDAALPHRLTSMFTERAGVSHSVLALNEYHDARLVTVTSVSGFGAEAKSYGTQMFEAIAEAGPRTCGYVLDLRGNTGGNVWPMLLGLSGLLGDGPQGISEDGHGKVEAYATLVKGAAIVLAEQGRGATMMSISNWRPLPRLQNAPVALLLDDATASSGEGVAVAFAGRRFTRTFGARTYGVASSNEGFVLPDGTNMVVTTGMMMDRLHHTYPNGVAPDQVVKSGGDEPVMAAKQWLSVQSACSGGPSRST